LPKAERPRASGLAIRHIVRALLVLATVVVALGAWVFWPRAAAAPDPRDPNGIGPSPELAESTLDRFERFRAGGAGGRLALVDAEIGSVLRFALPGILPPGVSDPDVRMAGSDVTLTARVATRAFPDLPALAPVIGMLPDTVSVLMAGTLTQFGKQSLAFHIEHVEAGGVPLPDRLVPEVLAGLGRTHRGGLPENALHIPLPAGIDSVYVERDSLVLLGGR
jgi:hypothetical protein